MFTTQKIEPSLWPWAYLNSIGSAEQTTSVEQREQVPVLRMQDGIGSGHDIRYVFKDMYVDLRREVEEGTQLSIDADQSYLS